MMSRQNNTPLIQRLSIDGCIMYDWLPLKKAKISNFSSNLSLSSSCYDDPEIISTQIITQLLMFLFGRYTTIPFSLLFIKIIFPINFSPLDRGIGRHKFLRALGAA